MRTGGENIKSTADHKKAGTFRKDRHANRAETITKPLETLPDAPEYFDKRHIKKWQETCKRMLDLSVLADQDQDLIEVYVCHWFLWVDSSADVRKRGVTYNDEGRIIKNPAVTIMNESAKVVNQMGALFGFSPRARMGIKVAPKDEHKKQASILDFIKGGNKKAI